MKWLGLRKSFGEDLILADGFLKLKINCIRNLKYERNIGLNFRRRYEASTKVTVHMEFTKLSSFRSFVKIDSEDTSKIVLEKKSHLSLVITIAKYLIIKMEIIHEMQY